MTSASEVRNFGVLELCDWLEDKEDITAEITDVMKRNRVNGKTFLDLTEADLKELFPLMGERKTVQRIAAHFIPHPPVVSLDVNTSPCL